jgi:hypothetical protein
LVRRDVRCERSTLGLMEQRSAQSDLRAQRRKQSELCRHLQQPQHPQGRRPRTPLASEGRTDIGWCRVGGAHPHPRSLRKGQRLGLRPLQLCSSCHAVWHTHCTRSLRSRSLAGTRTTISLSRRPPLTQLRGSLGLSHDRRALRGGGVRTVSGTVPS